MPASSIALAPCRLLRTASSGGDRWRTCLLPRSPVHPSRSAHRRLYLCAVLLHRQCCRRRVNPYSHYLLSELATRSLKTDSHVASRPLRCRCLHSRAAFHRLNATTRNTLKPQRRLQSRSAPAHPRAAHPNRKFRGHRTDLRYRATPLLHRNATR